MAHNSDAQEGAAPRTAWRRGAVPLCLLALTLLLFGDALFVPGQTVLSNAGTDTAMYFAYAREFGFGQMRQGHVPLWNPYLYSGAPFAGTFQSALFYPPNLLYLVLPLAKAINTDIALHIFLAGWGASLLASRRGLRPLACLLTGALVMFGGPYFLKVYAGHLSPLDAMAWVPFVLLAVDVMWEGKMAAGLLLGAGAAAMQMLAGHPQTVFNTGVTVVLYAALRFAGARRDPLIRQGRRLLTLGGMYAGAGLLAAVQLLTGAQAATESTRANGAVPFAFASSFSLPPENLLTLAAPNVFGDMTGLPYWGRCYLWEVSLFMGAGGLALAVYGAFCGRAGLGRRAAALMTLLLLMLALGAHTPLFRVLYDYAPGFDKFRGHAKFIVQAAVFLALLAGMGLDRLLTDGHKTRNAAWGAAGAALLLASAGLWAATSGARDQLPAFVQATGESYFPPARAADPAFGVAARSFAARSLLTGAGLLAGCAALFLLTRRRRWAAPVFAALAIAEVVTFARGSRDTFDLSATRHPDIARFVARTPGDYRVLNAVQPDSGMATGTPGIWGYDPFVLKRYAEFMAWTQGQDPDAATMYVSFSRLPYSYALLRCRFAFMPDGRGGARVVNGPPPLPHVLLVPQWTTAKGRDAVFDALSTPGFDPRRTVVLENAPQFAPPVPPSPAPPPAGVRVTAQGTDFLDIEANVSRPAILLVTDAYSSGWHIVAAPGGAQARREIMPADYILRAVPLSAGHHVLRMEYRPQAFTVGAWVSAASLAAYLLLLTGHGLARRRSLTAAAPENTHE